MIWYQSLNFLPKQDKLRGIPSKMFSSPAQIWRLSKIKWCCQRGRKRRKDITVWWLFLSDTQYLSQGRGLCKVCTSNAMKLGLWRRESSCGQNRSSLCVSQWEVFQSKPYFPRLLLSRDTLNSPYRRSQNVKTDAAYTGFQLNWPSQVFGWETSAFLNRYLKRHKILSNKVVSHLRFQSFKRTLSCWFAEEFPQRFLPIHLQQIHSHLLWALHFQWGMSLHLI